MNFQPMRWLLPCISIFCVAQGAWASESLSLSDAIARSQQHNPELKAFGYVLSAQDGRTLQAGLKPNPELTVDVEDALGTGMRRGISEAQTTIAWRQNIERGAVQSRLAAAHAERATLDAEMLEKRFEVSVETARRFAQVVSHQRRLQLLQEGIVLAKQTEAAARLRVQAAKAPEAELARALAQLARAELEFEDAEHELLTAKHQLAALWGDNQVDFDRATGTIAPLVTLPPFAQFVARLDANPSLQKFEPELRLREAELGLALQRRKPAWEFNVGVRRFEQGNDFAGVIGVRIPLTWNDRGQGQSAIAQAGVDKVDADRQAAQVQLSARLFALYQELGHALHVTKKLEEEVLPRIREALVQTEYAYARGRYGYLELISAQRELLDVKAAQIQAQSDVMHYAIEIDHVIGAVPGTANAVTQLHSSSIPVAQSAADPNRTEK